MRHVQRLWAVPSPRLWAVPPATDAGIATPAGVLLHASAHLGHQLVTAQAANRLVSTEQAKSVTKSIAVSCPPTEDSEPVRNYDELHGTLGRLAHR